MSKPCKCGDAREWLKGYAEAFCAARNAGITMTPLFPEAQDTVTSESTCLTRVDCPASCTQQDCDDIFNSFEQSCKNCLDATCRAQVQAAYAAAIAGCVSA